MMEKTKLRGADIITAAILIIFGIWELVETFKMPMKDSFGGVMNVWYVSPALFPMIIGGGIIILALNILIHGLKNGGMASLKAMIGEKKQAGISESGYRFMAILLPLFSLVYMNLSRIDFFLCVALFLSFTITVFYLDDMGLLKKITLFYLAEMAVLFLLFLFNIHKVLNALFPYSTDSIALVLLVLLIVRMYRAVSGNTDYRRKFRHSMIMSFLIPLLLVPAFRFLLRVPLPTEGGIVDLMYLVYYAFR
jgi:hypothetical protein